MNRILKDTAATLSVTFSVDGFPTDPTPATATVTITNAVGTVVVATTAATRTFPGVFTYQLTAAQTGDLDTLTAHWTTANLGTVTSTIEVVGGFLFRIDELRTEVANSTTTYTPTQMADARTYAETQLEQECGAAFVPRYELESFSASGTTISSLRWPRVTAIRSVTIDGAPVTPTSSVVALREGQAYYSSGWTAGYGNVQIGYEHGATVLDPGASEAALVLAKHKLVKGPIDERATQRTSEFGPVNLATPGMFGSRFGIPVVDAFCAANNMNVGVA